MTEKTNQEENQLRKLSETHDFSKPIRPKSSRPPAPNRRPQSNTYTEYLNIALLLFWHEFYPVYCFRIPKHSDSFFSINDNKVDDIDDNIITIEVVNDNKLAYDSYIQVIRLFI